jgi:hypothetical protein
MKNLAAIETWKTWLKENETYPGDVTPADSPNVDFWFAQNGEKANTFLHCFASGGDGSLLCLYSREGNFDEAPVVHLGNEGDVFVIAKDVPHALALVAMSGSSYEQAIYYDEDLELDEASAKWLAKTFDVKPPKSVAEAVKSTNAKIGNAPKDHIEALNMGLAKD